ncbi:BMP family ABC transporter substrate-binding protein [Anaerobacillus sp. MEB173]|uniref:BMP family ABC transporter substrate-binding protein n=1 Tax=Anaerobacillus sp. MEB173 TaxID=3383345 RepID=UPI003F8D9402
MRAIVLLFIGLFVFSLTGCGSEATGSLKKVGLLLTDTVNDEGWNNKGYEGLLNIHSNVNVDIYYKEGVITETAIRESVAEFSDEGVNLIFGHGRLYTDAFMKLKDKYPHIHFVGFNGEVSGKNITSIHFLGHAMGFFGGMVASEMSTNKQVGIIAAFPWQPEVEGFVDGAKYQNEQVDVHIEYISGWGSTPDEVDHAIQIFEEMASRGVDVFYPTGDGYHVPVVEEIKKAGLYAIGYVGEQSDLGETTILTSTIQNVDTLYTLTAEYFNEGTLQSGNLYYDFDNRVISLGQYSSVVPEDLQHAVNQAIEDYISTGVLPDRLKKE